MRPFLGWVCRVLWMGSAGFAWLVVEADDSADGVVDYSEFLAACVSVAWGQCTGSAGASANGCQLNLGNVTNHMNPLFSLLKLTHLI